jgi:asparagine synthase (glutamine-hydrolysing)
MIGIFGIIRHDGSPITTTSLEAMRHAMAEWGQDRSNLICVGPIGLGQIGLPSTPEARIERMPCSDRTYNMVFTAAGRVDNRDAILRQLDVKNNRELIPDSEVLLHSYAKWRENSPVRIYGDWSFAAWHPDERKLFLARDHYGVTSLYYYADNRVFAFASSRKALLALALAPMEMDELYLAQVLTSSRAYHGERTIHPSIKRLPPAHCLTVSPNRMDVECYWRLEDLSELHLQKKEEYVDAFKEVFDEAVRCRLRSDGGVAVTLSGGLDSGSVAVTAAGFLRGARKRLTAFTSVPLSESDSFVGEMRFGNEYPFAQSTAQYVGNIDLYRITAETVTPVQAIRKMLSMGNEPGQAAANYYWLHALRKEAVERGCRVLLTGQVGNASISWLGWPNSQPILFQLRHFGWRGLSLELAKQHAPTFLRKWYRELRKAPGGLWQASAIHPDLARRFDMEERMMSDPYKSPRTPLEHRYRILLPGRSLLGARWAESAAPYGLDIRDPTADVRVLAFTLSVPDRIFIDPATDLDRWLVREAMRGRLPDDVRLNRRRGRQASDLVFRLRACADEVEEALDELSAGPAASYVHVSYMRKVWSMIQTNDTQEAYHKAGTVLAKGIMAGLWVNGFCNAS